MNVTKQIRRLSFPATFFMFSITGNCIVAPQDVEKYIKSPFPSLSDPHQSPPIVAIGIFQAQVSPVNEVGLRPPTKQKRNEKRQARKHKSRDILNCVIKRTLDFISDNFYQHFTFYLTEATHLVYC